MTYMSPTPLPMPYLDPLRWALMFDLDGTLLDIASAPDEVSTPVGLVDTLADLRRIFGGALAIVTGRRIEDADRILMPLQLTTAGVHGGELRLDRGPIICIESAMPATLANAIRALAATMPGVFAEEKGSAISVHFRGVPVHRERLGQSLRDIVGSSPFDLVVGEGRMVYEIMPRHGGKGRAVAMLLDRTPFSGRRPLMIGDDAQDVAALEAARSFGGIGWTVGGEFVPRADADFAGPAAVRAWARALVDCHL